MAQDKGFSLAYDRLAFDDLARLDSFWQDEILSAIESKLSQAPQLFGKPLRQTLKGCWSLRVGDYRVVYQIHASTVRILAVVHRSSDYKSVTKRL